MWQEVNLQLLKQKTQEQYEHTTRYANVREGRTPAVQVPAFTWTWDLARMRSGKTIFIVISGLDLNISQGHS